MAIQFQDLKETTKACIIWMHGLGSNGNDLRLMTQQTLVGKLPVKHVFPDAPKRPVSINGGMVMQAWYDITGLSFNAREDRDGIYHSTDLIKELINVQIKEGFKDHQIFLAGFSQGGAIALYTALTSELSLAGVITLSSYLPLAAELKPVLPETTPIFMAAGLYDQVVLPAWTKQAANFLTCMGYKSLTLNEYPMEHSICLEEVQALTEWITRILGEIT